MAEKNFFDEIVECLRNTRKTSPAVPVSEAVLKEFMTDLPHRQPHPAPPAPPSAPQTTAIRTPVPEMVRETPPPATASVPALSPAQIMQMDWQELAAAVADCHACRLCEHRRHTVFEDGSRQARLLFFGEGPGADEDAQGIPFVGKAGELLTKMIHAMQFSREEVYICNTVKCRPPGNRNPEPDETEACRAFAMRQIELVKPEVIVILGAVPLRFLFPKIYGGIRSMRGKWMNFNGIRVMPTYHPAYLLRDPAAKADAWKDLQQVMAVFGKTPPSRRRG